ncbi:hypothetical protein PROFUN_15384 [Planoprotostelium fungivorum]|uniref:Uncharacterized protein n=1 Tax=Planoprotostelium fungivorum TaxID=1890364 RepID=A0A2P6MVK2_9EUKA|nr:hypothetical protein PROFUN_15384 [Planoprotostelium fungivorum]
MRLLQILHRQSGSRNSAYEKELNAGHTNRAAVLRPPPGMKIRHLPKGIREYVSTNPADFKEQKPKFLLYLP